MMASATKRIGNKKARKKTVRKQADRSAKSRAELLQSAIECIAELGLEKATIATIAQRANLTAGAVQHHFKTRNSVYFSILDDFGQRLANIFAEGSNLHAHSVRDRVEFLLNEIWDIFNRAQFISVTEILLSSRSAPQLHSELLDKVEIISDMMDQRWINAFADQKIKPELIITARRTAQATIRGLALRSKYWRPRADLTKERKLLLRMLLNEFERIG